MATVVKVEMIRRRQLDGLIDCYEQNRPEAGRVLTVRLKPHAVESMLGEAAQPLGNGEYEYRGRRIRALL